MKNLSTDTDFWRQPVTLSRAIIAPGNIRLPSGSKGRMIGVPTVTNVTVDDRMKVVSFEVMVRIAVPEVPQPFEVELGSLLLK